jgi:hypothetical protein
VIYDAGSKDKRELLSDWVAIMRQLRTLGVIRTNNNPIGDIAEAIVCDHYGGERASFSQKGWDVKAPRRRADPGQVTPQDAGVQPDRPLPDQR